MVTVNRLCSKVTIAVSCKSAEYNPLILLYKRIASVFINK